MPYLFFTLFISVIVAVFAVQNAVSVSLNFAVWTMQTNLVIVILGSALLGALATLFFTLMMKAKHYLQDKRPAKRWRPCKRTMPSCVRRLRC